jgi:hypothetical protein
MHIAISSLICQLLLILYCCLMVLVIRCSFETCYYIIIIITIIDVVRYAICLSRINFG